MLSAGAALWQLVCVSGLPTVRLGILPRHGCVDSHLSAFGTAQVVDPWDQMDWRTEDEVRAGHFPGVSAGLACYSGHGHPSDISYCFVGYQNQQSLKGIRDLRGSRNLKGLGNLKGLWGLQALGNLKSLRNPKGSRSSVDPQNPRSIQGCLLVGSSVPGRWLPKLKNAPPWLFRSLGSKGWQA